jgi:hypothetical protein
MSKEFISAMALDVSSILLDRPQAELLEIAAKLSIIPIETQRPGNGQLMRYFVATDFMSLKQHLEDRADTNGTESDQQMITAC